MNNLTKWFEGRIPVRELSEFLQRKMVPVHGQTFWYLFGGLTLLFFAVQLVTGVLLSLYYQPTPGTAYESVVHITNEVKFGWLIRSIHRWAAHLVVFCMLVHMAAKYFFIAYRKPREATWISGVILLGVVLGFAFTGYLLPWTTEGYFATQIGIEIPGTTPIIGGLITRLLRGGEYVDGVTLTRVFSLHTVILPLIALSVILFHLIQNQYTGSAVPKGAIPARGMAFLPDFFYRDTLAWIAGTMVLLTLSLIFPIGTGLRADILASPPEGIRPEWYFVPLYQTIKWLPGTILGINTDILVNIGAVGLTMWLFLLPWVHKSREGRVTGTDRLFRFLGIVGLLYFTVTVLFAWLVT